jgi:hypothetical protein
MQTAPTTWRTRPQYAGHVADGYYLDNAGRLRYEPQPALDLARAKLFVLDLDDVPQPPAVQPVEIGGRWPRPENVAAIRRAVDEIPLRFRSLWRDAGGWLEIVPGSDAAIHPRFSRNAPALGWTAFHGPFCCVAGDHPDAPLTACHEIGHALDFALGYPSRSAAWLQIWRADVAAGRVPSDNQQREKPNEYWAEQFARRWSPDFLWARSREAQDFIENA